MVAKAGVPPTLVILQRRPPRLRDRGGQIVRLKWIAAKKRTVLNEQSELQDRQPCAPPYASSAPGVASGGSSAKSFGPGSARGPTWRKIARSEFACGRSSLAIRSQSSRTPGG